MDKMLEHVAALDKGEENVNAELFSEEYEKKIAQDNLRRATEVLQQVSLTDCNISYDGTRVYRKPAPTDPQEDDVDSDPEVEGIFKLGPKDGCPNGQAIPIERDYENIKEEEDVAFIDTSANLVPFGVVEKIIHRQVTVSKNKKIGLATLALDTIVYTLNREPIAKIEDLMGMVEEPLYVLRFPTKEDAERFPPGTEMYCAPSNAQYVFPSELAKMNIRDDGAGGDDSGDEQDETKVKKAPKRKLSTI